MLDEKDFLHVPRKGVIRWLTVIFLIIFGIGCLWVAAVEVANPKAGSSALVPKILEGIGQAILLAGVLLCIDMLIGWMVTKARSRWIPRAIGVDSSGCEFLFETREYSVAFLQEQLQKTKELRLHCQSFWHHRELYGILQNRMGSDTPCKATIICSAPDAPSLQPRAELEILMGRETASPAKLVNDWNEWVTNHGMATTAHLKVYQHHFPPASYFLITDEYLVLTPYWPKRNALSPTIVFSSKSFVYRDYKKVFDEFAERLSARVDTTNRYDQDVNSR